MNLQQPEWPVVRGIATAMAGCIHCHRSSGGGFLSDPPVLTSSHKSSQTGFKREKMTPNNNVLFLSVQIIRSIEKRIILVSYGTRSIWVLASCNMTLLFMTRWHFSTLFPFFAIKQMNVQMWSHFIILNGISSRLHFDWCAIASIARCGNWDMN